ncbi:MAG: RIP metalloprotease RseP [candidate division Zixibacteria bacterium]|nr:RIP metalloprotease RseP [candidate division Zixibacteria bacterium]
MLITILATVFVLGVLVFIHELGHFLVAKKSGIRVDKFSLGFPPTLISKKIGETEYAIGVIPLGGYVKMAGDNPDEGVTGAPYEFMSKPPWKRFLVISAGPVMNFVLAVVLISGLFFFRGQEIDRAIIGDIMPDGPAEMAGLLPDDYIVDIDGVEINTTAEMIAEIKDKIEEPLYITWKRGERLMSDTIVTFKDIGVTTDGDTIAVGKIGIVTGRAYEKLGLFSSIGAGFSQSANYTIATFQFIGGFFTGKSNSGDVGGPIFIATIAGATARAGFDILLEFMALLSVNLAVLNILPIPVFDGGHLMFLIAEKLKGSPLSMKIRMVAQQVGLVFILLLIVLITYNDITR